ncbi:MAG: sensor histidine kinase [Acidobacteriota bacterium]
MGWLRGAYLWPLVAALMVFGVLADHALTGQARLAGQQAVSDLDERARLMALSVRDTIGRIERSVLDGAPLTGVRTGEIPLGDRAGPRVNSAAYATRPRPELVALLASRSVTPNGLPEAVVAGVALGDGDSKSRVANDLLAGLLPVRPDDLPYLVESLGARLDDRAAALVAWLQRAPDPAQLPAAPEFRRQYAANGTVEAWSRTEIGLRAYATDARTLLAQAGLLDQAALTRGSANQGTSGDLVMAIPEVSGLALTVPPDTSVLLRIRALRIALWIAIASSCLGLAAMVRAVGREARAVAREKAFLASITHELRTPLTAIRVLAETLAEGRGNPPEYGELVARESQRLEALVEQVLATTRVDEAPSFDLVRPGEIVESAIELLQARAGTKALQVDWHPPILALPEACWDFDAVRRALLNLLDNAVKHGRSGGRVGISAEVDGDVVKLSVSDDGPGIGRRDRRRVFGRFERGPTEASGTGLGLYEVEQVARAHGGRVELVSEEHRGSTFTLVLPLRPGTRGPAVSGQTARAEA